MRRSSSTSRRASETGSSRRASETSSSRRNSEIGSPRRASVMDDRSEAAAPIRRKLRDSRIKIATIVHRCEQKDKNDDGIIHLDDLEDILNDIVPPENRITRRELVRFATVLMGEKNIGSIKYEKLSDIIEPARKRDSGEREKWVDIDEDDGDTRWATQPGSVGAFLKGSACPSEIKNFKKFVACLESFERDSGMKIHLKDDGGFSVPMGPDLRATISFSML